MKNLDNCIISRKQDCVTVTGFLTADPLTPAPLNVSTTEYQHGRMYNHTHRHKIVPLPSLALKSSGLIAQQMRTNMFAAGLPPPVEGESQPKAYKTLQL